jgi:hypothetical protein
MNTMVVNTVQKGRKPSRVNFNLSSKYGKKELHRKLSCVLSDELVVYSNSIRLFSSKCALEGNNDGFYFVVQKGGEKINQIRPAERRFEAPDSNQKKDRRRADDTNSTHLSLSVCGRTELNLHLKACKHVERER